MRKYNLMRPLIILVAAFATNNLVSFISLMFGATKETADNIGYFAMLVVAILLFMRMRKAQRK
jgi:hypothetical protein